MNNKQAWGRMDYHPQDPNLLGEVLVENGNRIVKKLIFSSFLIIYVIFGLFSVVNNVLTKPRVIIL